MRTLKYKSKGGGCGCSKNISFMNGGGDYFLQGYKEPPSFDKVPIRSFYEKNTFNNDPQTSQISSRLITNMKGGKTKKIHKKIIFKRKTWKGRKYRFRRQKNKKNKTSKIKGGFSTSYLMGKVSDPLLNNTNNTILSSGNTSGSLLGYNIFSGSDYTSSPNLVNLPKSYLV